MSGLIDIDFLQKIKKKTNLFFEMVFLQAAICAFFHFFSFSKLYLKVPEVCCFQCTRKNFVSYHAPKYNVDKNKARAISAELLV